MLATASDRDALRRLQDQRLRDAVRHAYDNTPFWRAKLDAAGVDPASIGGICDLPRLPTCDRPELQADQDEHPPAGSYAATAQSEWVRVFTTSGTSGRRLRRVLSVRDWDLFVERSGQDLALEPSDTVMLLGPTDGLFGPSANLEIAVRAQATVLGAGGWSTAKKLDEISVWRPTVLIGTASYLVRLSDVAAERGLDLATCGIRMLVSSGEPGASIPATRDLLMGRYGDVRLVDRYGMTELPTLTRCACSAHPGALHFNEDFLAVECLEPGGTEPMPPGDPGELVFTNLINDTQPVLRYRSGDIGRLGPDEDCDCGLPLVRLQRSVEGRADDMIWYHGVNLFPSAVENAVRSVDGAGPEYRLVLRGSREWPELTVQVERAGRGDDDALRTRLAAALKAAAQVSPAVELTDTGALAGPEGSAKAKRVLDLREEGPR